MHPSSRFRWERSSGLASSEKCLERSRWIVESRQRRGACDADLSRDRRRDRRDLGIIEMNRNRRTLSISAA